MHASAWALDSTLEPSLTLVSCRCTPLISSTICHGHFFIQSIQPGLIQLGALLLDNSVLTQLTGFSSWYYLSLSLWVINPVPMSSNIFSSFRLLQISCCPWQLTRSCFSSIQLPSVLLGQREPITSQLRGIVMLPIIWQLPVLPSLLLLLFFFFSSSHMLSIIQFVSPALHFFLFLSFWGVIIQFHVWSVVKATLRLLSVCPFPNTLCLCILVARIHSLILIINSQFHQILSFQFTIQSSPS